MHTVIKKNKILISLIIVSFFILYAIWASKHEKRIALANFKAFNETKIDGVLKYVGISHHGSAFEVSNNSTKFVFYPYTNSQINGNHIFDLFAKRGDKIVKNSFSDTLFLFKNGQVYRYTFQKPGEQ